MIAEDTHCAIQYNQEGINNWKKFNGELQMKKVVETLNKKPVNSWRWSTHQHPKNEPNATRDEAIDSLAHRLKALSLDFVVC